VGVRSWLKRKRWQWRHGGVRVRLGPVELRVGSRKQRERVLSEWPKGGFRTVEEESDFWDHTCTADMAGEPIEVRVRRPPELKARRRLEKEEKRTYEGTTTIGATSTNHFSDGSKEETHACDGCRHTWRPLGAFSQTTLCRASSSADTPDGCLSCDEANADGECNQWEDSGPNGAAGKAVQL